MGVRLSRRQWARQHAKLNVRDIVLPVLCAGFYLVASVHYDWDDQISPVVGAALIGLAVTVLAFIGEFVWSYSRAVILQDREELNALRPEVQDLRQQLESPLDLETWITSVKWTPFQPGGEPNTAPGYDVLLREVRITNRSPKHRVSLAVHATVGGKGGRPGIYDLYDSHNQMAIRPPLAIEPQETWTGTLGFVLMPVISPGGFVTVDLVEFDSLTLHIMDHVSSKRLNVPAPRGWRPPR